MNAQGIITAYLNFSGVRSALEIKILLDHANRCTVRSGSGVQQALSHIKVKLTQAHIAALSQPSKSLDLQIDTSKFFTDEQLGKFRDHGDVPHGGRQDEYWNQRSHRPEIQFDPKNQDVRKGPALHPNLSLDSERSVLEYFGVRAVEYGQWLTQQDRVNYLAGCALAMHDLATVLNFHPKQIGLYDLLSVAFGARGRGKALAHFEPDTFAVNLTRFERPEKVNERRHTFNRSALMHFSGGVGSFCHEYGHALDYYAGRFLEPAPANITGRDRKKWASLSNHTSVRVHPDLELMKKNTLRAKMERLLNKIIWKSPGEHSSYYERIIIQTQAYSKNTDYWIRRNEIFARAFEVYIASKMHQKGWFNTFLHRFKYNSPMYMTGAEFKTVEKDFDALIVGLRTVIKHGVGRFEKLPVYQKMVAARKSRKKR